MCDIIQVFQHQDPLKNIVDLFFTDKKKEATLYLEDKFELNYKDTIWKGAIKVLSEKSDELIGVQRLEVMGLYINIQVTRLISLFLADNSQLNIISDRAKIFCRAEADS